MVTQPCDARHLRLQSTCRKVPRRILKGDKYELDHTARHNAQLAGCTLSQILLTFAWYSSQRWSRPRARLGRPRSHVRPTGLDWQPSDDDDTSSSSGGSGVARKTAQLGNKTPLATAVPSQSTLSSRRRRP